MPAPRQRVTRAESYQFGVRRSYCPGRAGARSGADQCGVYWKTWYQPGPEFRRETRRPNARRPAGSRFNQVGKAMSVRPFRHPFGRPLRRVDLPHQVIAKKYALPVFASDALSSVAYATEEILKVLALAGLAYFT